MLILSPDTDEDLDLMLFYTNRHADVLPESDFLVNCPFSGGGERSFWGCLQSQMERQRRRNQDH